MNKKRMMTVVFAIAFVLIGVTIVKADLAFDSMEGTWWVTLKQMDKGYAFGYEPSAEGKDKAKNAKDKTKGGYMYIPPGSFEASEPFVYDDVVAIDPDPDGGWMNPVAFDLSILGGNPNDFAGSTVIAGDGFEMMLSIHAKLTEDKKDPGMIKSGQVSTLGSSVIYMLAEDKIFVGARDLKGKFVPEDKVPEDVKALVLPPE